ncbi:MAG: TolB family protein [Actinomycetota bacterium]
MTKSRLTTVLVAALVATVLSPARDVDAAFPGENGPISYQAFPNGAPDGIYVMQSDGSGQRLLIDSGLAGETHPSWSADGTRIAYQNDNDIFVANADGSSPQNLTNSPGVQDQHPSWSPEGTQIVYASTKNGSTFDIFVMNVDGSGERPLVTTNRGDFFPTWSPDGQWVGFTGDRLSPGSTGVHVIRADGTGQEQLVIGTAVANPDFDWSPDSTRLAVDFHQNDLWVVNRDGSNPVRLTTTQRSIFGVAWSPDGQRIAFRSDHLGNPDIYTINIDGSNLVNITNTPTVDERFPDWGIRPAPVPGCDPQRPGTICGTQGNDNLDVTVDGSTQNVVVQTGDGADTVELLIDDPGATTSVTIDTGDDRDTVLVPSAPGQVSVRVETGLGDDVVRPTTTSARARVTAQQSVRGYVVLTAGGNDRVRMGSSADTVDGGAGRDDVNGAGGADRLGGGGGGDDIEGGGGNDAMNGGGGADVLHGSDGRNVFNGGSGTDACLSDTKLDRFRSCERIRRNHRRNHQQV